MVTTKSNPESLARGYIPQARANLFLAKGKTLIVDITGRNDDSQKQTFNVFTRIAGAAIGKTPTNCCLAAGYSYNSLLEHPIILNNGDSIDGDCSSGTAISYEVSGIVL